MGVWGVGGEGSGGGSVGLNGVGTQGNCVGGVSSPVHCNIIQPCIHFMHNALIALRSSSTPLHTAPSAFPLILPPSNAPHNASLALPAHKKAASASPGPILK